MPSGSNDWPSDVLERVRELEVRQEPLLELPAKIEKIEDRLSPLPSLASRLDRLETTIDRVKAHACYVAGSILLALVLSGKMTIGEAIKLVRFAGL